MGYGLRLMKKYRVWALEETELEWPTIEAESEDQAQDIANEYWPLPQIVECRMIEMFVKEVEETE